MSERTHTALALLAAFAERHGWKAAWVSLWLVALLLVDRIF